MINFNATASLSPRQVTPKQKRNSFISLIIIGAILLATGLGLLISYFAGGKSDYVEVTKDFYYRCDYVGTSDSSTKPYLYTITGELKNTTDQTISLKLKGELESDRGRGMFEDSLVNIAAGGTYRVELLLEGNYAYDGISYIEVSVNGGAYETIYSSDRLYMSYMAYGLIVLGAVLVTIFVIKLVKHNKKVASGEIVEASQATNGWTTVDGRTPEMTEGVKADKKVCSYCGTKNDAKANKCSGCGSKLD